MVAHVASSAVRQGRLSCGLLQDIALDIIFEDEHLLVVNKPAGMVVHPSPGYWESGTLVNALLHHWQLPPILVHPEGEGLLLLCKPGYVHTASKQASKHMLVSHCLLVIAG